MTLRDLEYVCAVAELGHFGKAAAKCFVGQPTLSGQIRKLETELGVVLFERTKKSVRLTPAGKEIVAVARATIGTAARIGEVARAYRDPEAGRLRVGVIPTVAPSLAPRFLGPARKRFPDLDLVLAEDLTDRLVGRLRAGEIEAALVATEEPDPRLRSMRLYREPFLVAVPRGHKLERAKRVRLADLDAAELLLLADGHCLRDQALEVCGLERGATGADTTAASLETVIQLVSAGHGVTLIPALGARKALLRELRIVVHPFQARNAERTVRMVYRAGFPHEGLLEEMAGVIRRSLPDSVKPC